MENKNKAEEIKKIETLLEVLNEHGSFIDLSDAFDRNTELCVLEAMGRYLQSEIDELTNQLKQNLIKDIERTKEIEEISKSVDNLIKEKDELTKEVERLRKEREWISVEYILPNKHTEIITFDKISGFVFTDVKMNNNNKFFSSDCFGNDFDYDITHWQPLPNKPII